MEINIEEKLPYTDMLLGAMRKALKDKKILKVTPQRIEEVFQELGIKYK